ncbi:recombinase family protein [Calderihabitans maritimus]|uniref:Resolvase-like protein n=1 Tax=Calderihabitans maritimus TaxID=1246530 RepID=A0A1Z5HSE7_9FIRM|nr:recombinase family protein [Calderihabitans maritimus]GAW92348.1 resolvase-like protein [Calderihabitans maritimus]
MRALVYTRVSTAGQAEGFSLATQREACGKKARELGATEIIYLEDTYTGIELERPAMNKLREHVRARNVDLIVVYDPDRFSRNLNDLLIVTKEIDKAGITLQFVNFDWQNTPQGILFLQLRGAIAQFEHALIKERTTRGKRKKAAAGKIGGYAKPYGYKFNKESDELEIVPEEAEVVKKIFEWYTREQDPLSSYAIAKKLAAEGIPGPTGKGWFYSSILRMLKNETYTGIMKRKDEQPDWKPVRVPPIISRETWEKAQKRIEENRRFNPKRTRNEYLVQRLIYCGLCGRSLTVVNRTKGEKSWSYYTCPGRYPRKFGNQAEFTPCRLKAIRTTVLDDIIWQEISSRLRNPKIYITYLRKKKEAIVELPRRELRKAEKALKNTKAAVERANKAYFNGYINEVEYRKYIAEYTETEQYWRKEIARLKREIAERELALGEQRELHHYVQRLVASVDKLSFGKKQQIVRLLVKRLVIYPDLVEIRGHFHWVLAP